MKNSRSKIKSYLLKEAGIIKIVANLLAFKNYIQNLKQYYLNYKPSKRVNKKCIYFNVSDPSIYQRYLYPFVKFFSLNGYDIFFPKDFKQFRLLSKDKYSSLLLKERIIHFNKSQPNNNCLIIDDHILSPDYFSFLINKEVTNKVYYVPISQHPNMYYKKFWNEPINNIKRKRSIFMIGNFDESMYRDIEKNRFMKIISRINIYEFLEEKNLLTTFKTKINFLSFLQGEDDHKCILIKRDDFEIPMQELRTTLGNFSFFLACPGVVMPQSHNIIEAMSAGTIPILQDEYANTFFPALQHHYNAIIFTDLEDLYNKIMYIYTISDKEIKELRTNVEHYYQNYLTPASIVQNIVNNSYKKVYLLTEHNSLPLLEKRNLNNSFKLI